MITSSGLPDIETWRLELALACRDPETYSEVLSEAADADLHYSFGLIDLAIRIGEDGEPFVPTDIATEFAVVMAGLRDRCIAEAARRGIVLVPLPDPRDKRRAH